MAKVPKGRHRTPTQKGISLRIGNPGAAPAGPAGYEMSVRHALFDSGTPRNIALASIAPKASTEDLGALDDEMFRAASLAPDPVRRREMEAERWNRLNRLSDLPLGVMAAHRRHVLSLVFADAIAQGRIALDERHVRVGEWSVHCATGRVMRDGEPVDTPVEPPASPLRAVPWLPYDEALLQRIVDVVAGLLD